MPETPEKPESETSNQANPKSKPKRRTRVYPAPGKITGTKKQRARRAKSMQQQAEDRCQNGGRPSSYNPDFARQVELLAKRGATDVEIADFLGVTITTVWNWSTRHQEFFNALYRGKDEWDTRVERSLYLRAVGYTYDSEQVSINSKGKVTRVPIREHVPPSEGAAKMWLTNRRPHDWKDRRTVDIDPNAPLNVTIHGGLPKS